MVRWYHWSLKQAVCEKTENKVWFKIGDSSKLDYLTEMTESLATRCHSKSSRNRLHMLYRWFSHVIMRSCYPIDMSAPGYRCNEGDIVNAPAVMQNKQWWTILSCLLLAICYSLLALIVGWCYKIFYLIRYVCRETHVNHNLGDKFVFPDAGTLNFERTFYVISRSLCLWPNCNNYTVRAW